MMIDLHCAAWLPNRFGGSESKWTMLYDGRLYMVKFPDPIRTQKKTAPSYMGNHFSEHIGCRIFRMLGIPAQHTFLGLAQPPNSKREKIAVACEVFCQDGSGILIEFSKLLLHETDRAKRSKTSIEDVMHVIDTDVMIHGREQLKAFFWDMFVADCLIGNGDRHLDNWGVIEGDDHSLSPAPVYDCGSGLSPLLSDEAKGALLENVNAFKQQEYNLNSVYRMNGRRILYHEIFRDPPPELRAAILRIVPRIEESAAASDALIDETEGLSDIAKEYMKRSLALRREQILSPALKRC